MSNIKEELLGIFGDFSNEENWVMEIMTTFSRMVTEYRLKYKVSYCDMDKRLDLPSGTCRRLECFDFPLIPVDKLFEAITILQITKEAEKA